MNDVRSVEKHLLVASPFLRDPNFTGAVVLILHHQRDGAFGVVLNRPLCAGVRQALDNAAKCSLPVDLQVSFGGPVPSGLVAVHRRQSLADMEAWPGLYVSAQPKYVNQLIERGSHGYRLFLGYAGWEPGQLEAELARGEWIIAPAKVRHIFSDDRHLWFHVIRQIGLSIIQSALKTKHVPSDPLSN